MKQVLLSLAAVFSLCDEMGQLEKLVNFNKELQLAVEAPVELVQPEIILGLQ